MSHRFKADLYPSLRFYGEERQKNIVALSKREIKTVHEDLIPTLFCYTRGVKKAGLEKIL